MLIAHFEANLELIHELLPPESKLPKDFYQSKKLSGLKNVDSTRKSAPIPSRKAQKRLVCMPCLTF
jgi:hypothetical protein